MRKRRRGEETRVGDGGKAENYHKQNLGIGCLFGVLFWVGKYPGKLSNVWEEG